MRTLLLPALPEAGEVARSALKFCYEMGGKVPVEHPVYRIASVGSWGAHQNNSERDLQRLVKGMRLEVPIEYMNLRVHCHKANDIVEKQVACLYPDKMAGALFNRGEAVFRHFCFGQENARKYWRHLSQTSSWFQQHPAFDYDRKSCMVPFSLYGDEVQTYKNAECGVIDVLGWCSDFSAGQSPISRYLPIVCLSTHVICSETWVDLWSQLLPRVLRMVADDATHPWSRAGYRFMISSIQGDLAWIVSKFQLHNYRRNNFCSSCGCCKRHDDENMTIGAMSERATHRNTLVSHAAFMASGSEASRPLA